MDRQRVDGESLPSKRAFGADLDLRSASWFVDARSGGGKPCADLSRDCLEAGGTCQEARLHACRTDAGDGASVLWLLGLSGHRLLRAERPLWHAAGPDVPDRRAASFLHRRLSRLVTRPLSLHST